jgi:hypothetical protein
MNSLLFPVILGGASIIEIGGAFATIIWLMRDDEQTRRVMEEGFKLSAIIDQVKLREAGQSFRR